MRCRFFMLCMLGFSVLTATRAWAGFEYETEEGDFALKASGRIQGRFQYEEPETGANETAFEIPRARISLSGHAHGKAFHYKLQTDFGKGFVTLKDAYLDYTAIEGRLHVRAGQYKKPFSRQQLTSSGKQELVDRAITDKAFGAGRDIGVMVHSGKSPIEYAVGVFNGTGDKTHFSGDVLVDTTTGEGEVSGGKFSNVPGQVHPMVVVRGGYARGGIDGYSEADLEGGAFRFGVGGSLVVDFDATGNDNGAMLAELDAIAKVAGFSATAAFYTAHRQNGEVLTDLASAADGYHVQVGYLIAGRFQPALRYAAVMPAGPDNDTTELAAGLSVYFVKHKLKWQSDYALLTTADPAGDQSDHRIRTQIQLIF